MLKRILLAAVAVAVCSSTSYAQFEGLEVVFDNVAGAVVNRATISATGVFVPATNIDDVTFTATTTVQAIEFSGIYTASPFPGSDAFLAEADQNFTINIFGDNGAGVADIAAGTVASFAVGNQVNRVAAPNPNLEFSPNFPDSPDFSNLLSEAFDFTAAIDFTFVAGETFHLQIINAAPDSATAIFNQAVAANAGNAFSTLDTANLGGLVQQTFATDFQLLAVPEPSSAVLLALGLAGFAARRRR